MITTAAIIVIALSSSYTHVNGICPMQENGTTAVLLYQRISSGDLSDTIINAYIQNFLEKINNFGLIPENPGVSCKQLDCRAVTTL